MGLIGRSSVGTGLFILMIFISLSPTLHADSLVTLPPPPVEIDADQCGGVLDATVENTTLFYKYQTPYKQWESCIWTIQNFDTSLISFEVDTYFYYENEYDYISLGYFKDANYDDEESFVWIRLPTSVLPQLIEIPAPVVFLHFASTSTSPSLGFRVTFSATGVALQEPNLYYFENYFAYGEYGTFNYPHGQDNINGTGTGTGTWLYGNNRRTTIVIKADSGLPIEGNMNPTRLFVKQKGIQETPGCSADSLNLFMYGQGEDHWFKNDTSCEATPVNNKWSFYYPRNDPIIVTFKSDESIVGVGFELYWRNHY